MNIKILKEKDIFKGFISLRQVELQFEKFDGSWSEPVQRLVVHRSDAVAVLIYNRALRNVTMVRQFRYPVYSMEPEHGWSLEIVAGVIDAGENPAATAIREVEEETGFVIAAEKLISLGRIYPSPGAFSERIYLYAVDVSDCRRHGAGGGLAHEHEDVRVEAFGWDELSRMMARHEIEDAKSLITLQWLLTTIRER